MREEMLGFSHVKTGYGEKVVLKDVNFQVTRGEFVALIGSNGTGKSTLIKSVSGLLDLMGGSIRICQKELNSMKPRERAKLVAVVPQSYYVDYDFTVEDIVMMGRNPYITFRNRESQKDRDICSRAMALTKTDCFRGRKYNELSGGERQRVILARAIAQQPQIILLDEPTSALDIHHQIEVMELIRDLNRENDITILAVLHDINLAARFCSRIVMLREGVVSADGTPEEVISRSNMEMLYDMKLFIRQSALLEKPEIVPVRVMREKKAEKPLRIHLIGGDKGAVKILECLEDRGHQVSAGILTEGSHDLLIAEFLHLPVVKRGAFHTITAEDQKENLEMMKDADLVIVTDTPFGEGNIHNLDGLEEIKGELFICEGIREKDFTGGDLEKRLREIEEKRSVKYFRDVETIF